ncbi:MAG TPA: HK97 family phage prohead protease [Ignavibacteria bacterium]|nr:HK97 family phage prohead protease [Ignavibacteria bacterium]
MQILHKTFKTSNKEFNSSLRTIIHYISKAGVDEFGEVLVPGGMDDSRFKAVLWSHSLGLSLLDDRIPPPSELVIGKSLWRKADDDGVVACTEFANTPLGNDVMRFNAEGYINSWSVGWKPKGAKQFNSETGITVYPKWYLYEYSSVIIPANPDAINLMLKDAKSDGMKNILGREREVLELKNEVMGYSGKFGKLLNELNSAKNEIEDIRKEIKSIKVRITSPYNLKVKSRKEIVNEAVSRVMEEIVGRKIINDS